MKQNHKFWEMARVTLFLALAILATVTLPSRQAMAQACVCCPACGVCCGDGAIAGAMQAKAKGAETTSIVGEWATEFSKWAQQFSFLTTMIGLYNSFNNFVGDNMASLGALINGGQQAETEARVRIATGVAESENQTQAANATAIVAGNLTPPTNDNQAACNTIAIRQGRAGSSWWQNMLGGQLANLIQERGRKSNQQVQMASNNSDHTASGFVKIGMIDNRYRGPGNDGTGQQYAADERDLRCGTNTGVSTGNALDGYSGGCLASQPYLVDADISFATLNGQEVFEMPTLQTRSFLGITVRVPVASTKPQQLYIAATNYCAFAAGPRPTPPYGKDADSPEGVVQMTAFDHATALGSAFVTQCTRRVAYLTRPNCSDPTQYADPNVKATCDAANKACAAFVANHGQLPHDIDPAGTNTCPNGLSPYQMDWISHMACTLNQSYTSGAGAGISQGKMMNFSTYCDVGITEWQGKIIKENLNLVKAFRGIMELETAGTGATAGKTMRINAPGGDAAGPRQQDAAAGKGPATKVSTKKGQGVTLRPSPVDLVIPAQ